MITRRLGRATVQGATEDFPLKLGERIRIKQPNGTTHEYHLVGMVHDSYVAEVTLKTPTTNKPKIGVFTRG